MMNQSQTTYNRLLELYKEMESHDINLNLCVSEGRFHHIQEALKKRVACLADLSCALKDKSLHMSTAEHQALKKIHQKLLERESHLKELIKLERQEQLNNLQHFNTGKASAAPYLKSVSSRRYQI